MLSLQDKISYLETLLISDNEAYADTFKENIIIFFDDDFIAENSQFSFLERFHTKNDIKLWLDNLLSQIVMKFDDENEQLSDFIYCFIE